MGSVNKLTHMPYQKKDLSHLNKDCRSNGNFVGESASYPDLFLTQEILGVVLKEWAELNLVFTSSLLFLLFDQKKRKNPKNSQLFISVLSA